MTTDTIYAPPRPQLTTLLALSRGEGTYKENKRCEQLTRSPRGHPLEPMEEKDPSKEEKWFDKQEGVTMTKACNNLRIHKKSLLNCMKRTTLHLV